jgi:hypothetical protein
MGESATLSTSNPRFRLMCSRFCSRMRFLEHTEQYFCRILTTRFRQSLPLHILVACRTAVLSSQGGPPGSSCGENCDPLKRANRSLDVLSHFVNCITAFIFIPRFVSVDPAKLAELGNDIAPTVAGAPANLQIGDAPSALPVVNRSS